MRWLAVAALCGLIGFWALETYFDERSYNRLCKDARRERLRKMNIGAQILSEADLDL